MAEPLRDKPVRDGPWPVIASIPLDDLPDGIIVAGPDGIVGALNERAARTLSVDREVAVGKHLRDVLTLSDSEGRDWYGCTDPYGGLRSRTALSEQVWLLPDGSEVLASAAIRRDLTGPSTAGDPAGRAPGARGGPVRSVVVVLRRPVLWRKNQRQGADLVATVAHELRSPLTSVKGFTATLLAKWPRFTDDQRKLMLETVNADADRLGRLITELLDVARIEAGRLEIRRVPLDVAGLVRRNVARHAAGDAGTGRFVVEIDPAVGEVWADADKLDQVLGNLLDNAVKHGAGTVTVRAGREPAAAGTGGRRGDLVVEVSDEGDGVPEEQTSRVFAKFWRAGRHGGTGLGLYIVRGIVHAHGGTIAADRAPSGGARFVVRLPVVPAPGEASEPAAAAP